MARKAEQPTNIPTATLSTAKTKRDSAQKLYVDTSKAANEVIDPVKTTDLETMIGDGLRLMVPPDGAEDVTLPAEVYMQMALFSNAYLTRVLYERYRK